MTPHRWTRRIILRTFLIVGLAMGMIALSSHLVFNYEGALWFFSVVGITTTVLTAILFLAYVLLWDDAQGSPPVKEDWKQP